MNWFLSSSDYIVKIYLASLCFNYLFTSKTHSQLIIRNNVIADDDESGIINSTIIRQEVDKTMFSNIKLHFPNEQENSKLQKQSKVLWLISTTRCKESLNSFKLCFETTSTVFIKSSFTRFVILILEEFLALGSRYFQPPNRGFKYHYSRELALYTHSSPVIYIPS